MHGVPVKLVSDRDPKYTSSSLKSLVELLSIRSNPSTAKYLETDGQSENFIQTVSNMLWISKQKITLE